MKAHRHWLFPSLMLTMASATAHAQSGPDADLVGIYQRETNVSATLLNVGHYENARERYILGPAGLNEQAKSFQEDAKAWLAAWKEFRAQSAQWSRLDELQTRVTVFLREQSAALAKLEGKGQGIHHDADQFLRAVATGDSWQGGDAFAEHLQRLKDTRQDITKAVQGLQEETARTLDVMRRIMRAFDWRFLTVRAKEIALASALADVSPFLAELNATIRAETDFRPALAALTHQARRLETTIFRMRLFTAKDDLARLTSACAATRDTVRNSGTSQALQQAYVKEIDDICQEATDRFDNLARSYGAPKIIASMHKANVRRHKNACSMSAPKIDCAAFQWLKDLDAASIETMSEGQLRSLETRWLEAERHEGDEP